MGTPDFAVAILQEIIAQKFEVVGVVTAPDKPAGRGRKLKASAVKEYALQKELNIYQPTNLKSDSFEADLQKMNPNLIVVVAFRMLPKKVWSFPEFGTFNLHASLLPDYRGAAPIHWAVINNEDTTGVTTFFIDDEIDTGEIILSKSVQIEKEETTGEVYIKLMNIGKVAVTETLELIKINGNKVGTSPQNKKEKYKEAPKLNRENTKIDWTLSGDQIVNLIRGLCPFPLAWSKLENNGQKLVCKFYKATYQRANHNKKPGEINKLNKRIYIACADGYILPEELKLEGKKKMSMTELLNGYTFEDSALFS